MCTGDRSHPSAVRFRQALCQTFGVDPQAIERPGTTVAPLDERAESGQASVYWLDGHSLVVVDPLCVDRVSALIDPALGLDRNVVQGWAADDDVELLGQATVRTLLEVHDAGSVPGDVELLVLNARRRDHRELFEAFVAELSAEDVDAADFDAAHLDALAVGAVDRSGALVGLASARPFFWAADFGDIGVATVEDRRKVGLGAALVARLVGVIESAGMEPLYRFNDDNVGSERLAAAVGFADALDLIAVRFGSSGEDRAGS